MIRRSKFPPCLPPPRVLVVGFGGIGGVVTGRLLEAGVPIACIARGQAVRDAVRAGGLRLREGGVTRTIRGALTLYAAPPGDVLFDYVVLATPPTHIEAVAVSLLPTLAPGGRLVCLQNGLCEERLAAVSPHMPVIGAVVMFGASSPAPGRFERTSRGGFVLGYLTGGHDAALRRLAALLVAVGPVTLTSRLRGVRWSKLALNCAISSLGAVGGERLGVLMRARFVRRLALEIVSEVVAVAEAQGVALERLPRAVDLRRLALTAADRGQRRGSGALFAKHALVLALGTRYRRLRSSMLAQLERGRTPPVDYLNGEVIERAARLGLTVPINRAVHEAVHRIAAGQARSSIDTLRELYRATR